VARRHVRRSTGGGSVLEQAAPYHGRSAAYSNRLLPNAHKTPQHPVFETRRLNFNRNCPADRSII